jgi:AcrR family transcriptional regulator
METAFSLFLYKGYAASVSEIVDKAGVSKGALYHYFNNKEDLFESTIQKYFLNSKKDYGFVYLKDIDIISKIRKIIYTYFSSFLNENGQNRFSPDMQSNLFHIIAEYTDKPKIREVFFEDYNRLVQAFNDMLANYHPAQNFKISRIEMAELSAKLTKGHMIDLIFDTTDDIKTNIEKLTNLVYTIIRSFLTNVEPQTLY